METMKNSPNLSQININSHTEGLLIIVAIAQYNMPSVQEKNYMTNSKTNTVSSLQFSVDLVAVGQRGQGK